MDSQLLFARARDLRSLCKKTSSVKFLGFLTPAETAEVIKLFNNSPANYRLWGGYEGAERIIFAFLPDWCEDVSFPITALTFNYRVCDKLTHRDFLGSLMALGIARETVGDILVESGRAVAFVTQEIAPYISSQIQKVGNIGVQMSEGFSLPLPMVSKLISCTCTVASVRLDCVVASLCSFSRNDANDSILNGEVSINSVCCQKGTRSVKTGDIIAVRHKGRFIIDSTDGLSKKGRIILKYSKFA